MNMKRFVLACLAVFVFVFFYEWGFHGKFLQTTYAQIPSLLRPKDDFMNHMGWLILGQFIIAVAFCLIYTRADAAKRSVGFAIGYGLAVAVLATGGQLIRYAVEPLPLNLVEYWFVGNIVECGIAGAILGAVYRNPPAVTAAT